MRFILGFIMKDILNVILLWKMVVLLLAVIVVFLLIVFMVNHDFPTTVSVAGGIFLVIGLIVVSRGMLAGALILWILGVAIIVISSWF